MEDLNNLNKKTHKVTMAGRRNCSITGVNDVLSFDVKEVLLETELGMLMNRQPYILRARFFCQE